MSNPKRHFTVFDPRLQREVEVVIHRDKRLKRTVRWLQEPDGHIVLRVPFYLPWKEMPYWIEKVEAALKRLYKKSLQRTDDDLARRAREVNRKYFGGKVPWTAIRWVNNMEKRLGSVTLGGGTHGHIRISARIRRWPQWVIDYVIAHEFVHLLAPEAGHSEKFWKILQEAYPLTERARGFISGYFFAKGDTDTSLEDTAL